MPGYATTPAGQGEVACRTGRGSLAKEKWRAIRDFAGSDYAIGGRGRGRAGTGAVWKLIAAILRRALLAQGGQDSQHRHWESSSTRAEGPNSERLKWAS